MSDIQKLEVKHLDRLIEIWGNAYPGSTIPSGGELKKLKESLATRINDDPQTNFYGHFEDNDMQAVIRLHDYQMNLYGRKMLVGGGGALAVDLCHKKEHIALNFMRFFFDHFRNRSCPLAILWSFRPDFYAKMGCGLGTRTDFYKIPPTNLPAGGDKSKVRFMIEGDIPALVDCYNRYVDKTHGMIEDRMFDREIAFKRQKNSRFIGYFENNILLGYIIFTFSRGKSNNDLDNNIQISEWIYETPAARDGLLLFLHSQAEQIANVIIPTPDENFHYLLKDPRNTSGNLHQPAYHESCVSTVGLMYRVLCTEGMFRSLEHRNFGGETCQVKIDVADDFIADNNHPIVVQFSGGKPSIADPDGDVDVTLSMKMPAFSSLIIGAIDLRTLIDYGQAQVSDDAWLQKLIKMFASQTKPICLTQF